jgi:FlgD Ig-like domain
MKPRMGVLLAAALGITLVASVVLVRSATTSGRTVVSTDSSFTVVNNGMTSYRINGVDNAPLTLNRGQTIMFNVTATGHPFFIKTQRVTGTGSQYTTGVTGNGATNGTVTWVIAADAPSPLFYQCSVHSAMGGTITLQTILSVPPGNPSAVSLGPARPNPAHESAEIPFALPREQQVSLTIFDERGRRVATLIDGIQPPGYHQARWDGRDASGRPVPGGMYFFELRSDARPLSGRVVWAR